MGAALDEAIRRALPEAAVLTAEPAPVTLEFAVEVLKRHWGLAGTLKPLAGERDANFLLQPVTEGARCMLKLSHPEEEALVADFQTQALQHLAAADPQLPVQRLRPSLAGEASMAIVDADGRPRIARVFSYLEGLPLPQAPRTAAQRRSVARRLAQLDRALAGLSHPVADRELPWDIQRAHRVRPLLVHIADPARRALAAAALDGFEARTLPVLAGLRRQPIHNDFNPSNLLVDPADTDRVSAILDFGDMVHAPLVNEVAVAASYHLEPEANVPDQALATLARFAADYHALNPLTAAECDALLDLVRARLAMVVAISGWRSARQPDNAAYLMRNNAVSWARLGACAALEPAQVVQAIREAIERDGLEPPATAQPLAHSASP